MMTTRPWPPLQHRPFAAPPLYYDLMFGKPSKSRHYQEMAWCGVRVPASAPPGNNSRRDNFFFTPIYKPTSFALTTLPPVGLIPKHMTTMEESSPLDRVRYQQQQQHYKHHSPTDPSSTRTCSCTCPKVRSRSLENLCCTEYVNRDTNFANNYFRRRCRGSKENFKKRSMDNLPEVSVEQRNKNTRQDGDGQSFNDNRSQFQAVTTLEDVQAIRCAEFHPQGNLYAVGSNSKTLRICTYPRLHDLRDEPKSRQPTVLFKRRKHHKGSIYCMAWSPSGDLLATGSNDKIVKIMRFDNDTSNFQGQEIELAMHDGTVRDVCFLEDSASKLLISGGAGDCKIHVTDCATGRSYETFSGHCGHVLSLYSWASHVFISGSQDRTVHFWDLRTRGYTSVITPSTTTISKGSPVTAVCVDPSGRLLVSGHEDSSCVLYDIRGSRTLQCFQPHRSDIRSIRLSPNAYYLLTGSYDSKLVLSDLQGDLTSLLPSVVVARHRDKVISARWHPSDFSFLSTSADKTSSLWVLPSS